VFLLPSQLRPEHGIARHSLARLRPPRGVPWLVVVTFGAMTTAEIRGILIRAGYKVVRQESTHLRLEAEGRQPLTLALRKKEMAPGLVRKILMKDAGLSEDEIKKLL
jgi:predicted RNA binding protein YcfA (HicA-like mRNA interferase family)